ncbi:MAG: DMT family transporter [Gammaproteobacteria bacterium]|jgi:transporter family-2 protein
MKTFLYILLVIGVGALTPIQATFNARIGSLLENPFFGTTINFFVGLVAMLGLLAALRPELPSFRQVAAVPPYLYLGGIIGTMLVTSLIVTVPKIGAATAIMAMVVGQMLISILIDHNGWLGVPVNPVSTSRVSGALLLLAGLYLIQKTA